MKKPKISLGIKTQIFAGFGTVIILSMIAGTIAVYSMYGFSQSFNTYESMTKETQLASKIDHDMGKALQNSHKFISSQSKEDLKAAKKYIQEVIKDAKIAQAQFSNQYRSERMTQISDHIQKYDQGLERIVKLYTELDQLVKTQLDALGPIVQKGLSEITKAGVDNGDLYMVFDTSVVQEKLMLGQFFVTNYMLTNAESDLKRIVTELDAAEKAALKLQKNILHPKRQATLKKIIPLFQKYKEAAFSLGKLIKERNKIRTEIIDQLGAKIIALTTDIKQNAIKDTEKLSQTTKADISLSELETVAALVVALIIALVAALFISRSLAGSIRKMTGVMERLSEGETDINVPTDSNTVEIKQMASALQIFKDNAIERIALQDQSEKSHSARIKRENLINDLIEKFRTSISTAIGELNDNSSQMKDVVDVIQGVTKSTTSKAGQAIDASRHASENVQAVATSADQLTSSISEISQQVVQTNTILDKAASVAETTDTRVLELSQAAVKIGEVLALIEEIAEQTNLLALNATIEAARAGEQGKGFAVVAAEVKGLANQTATATESISKQVKDIQEETEAAVLSIREISKIMNEASTSTTAIVSAVEEQSAATSEISRNIHEASEGSHIVSENIQGVSAASTDAEESTEQINQVSAKLSQQADNLTVVIEDFLTKVSAA